MTIMNIVLSCTRDEHGAPLWSIRATSPDGTLVCWLGTGRTPAGVLKALAKAAANGQIEFPDRLPAGIELDWTRPS